MNIPELEKLLNSFYQISGIEVALFDSKYHSVISIKNSTDNFCKVIHRLPRCMDICIESDLQHLKQLSSNPKPITYTCPFGFFTSFVPIMKDNEPVAYLTLAPAICEDFPSNPYNELIQKAIPPTKIMNEKVLKESLSSIPRYTKAKLDAFTEILIAIAQVIETRQLVSTQEQSISFLTKNYIDQHIRSKITLADLSWHLHCSTVTLTEHFRKDYGISIMQYVLNQRMLLAEKLLSEGVHTINSVALLCGFPDVEYFSRTFKKFHGVTPSKWNKN